MRENSKLFKFSGKEVRALTPMVLVPQIPLEVLCGLSYPRGREPRLLMLSIPIIPPPDGTLRNQVVQVPGHQTENLTTSWSHHNSVNIKSSLSNVSVSENWNILPKSYFTENFAVTSSFCKCYTSQSCPSFFSYEYKLP